MTESTASLRRRIDSANDLQSVVRTMKALAASSIGQYEDSVRALADYYRSVELGLGACFRAAGPAPSHVRGPAAAAPAAVVAVVFGSDQGLVGRFNEAVAAHAVQTLASLPGTPLVWAVGERVHALLADAGLPPVGLLAVPASVNAIAPLVGQILVQSQAPGRHAAGSQLHLFYNSRATGATYDSVGQRLLPLDEAWRRERAGLPWPTKNPPEVLGDIPATLAALVGEYLFVSLFNACARSLASENASRLAAMERADRNIDESLVDLRARFHQLRQSGIDEELFDVVSGFEALSRRA